LAVNLPGIAQEGISDLALQGRKFSGNAQQRKQSVLLHHGTLLWNFDLPRVSRYLKPPPRQPDYRQQREHQQFLANLPLSGSEMKERLRRTWQAEREESTWPVELVRKLCLEKYDRSEWTRRR
jgi:lipoate-protein ligase A